MNIDFANLKMAYVAHQEEFEKEIAKVLSDASPLSFFKDLLSFIN